MKNMNVHTMNNRLQKTIVWIVFWLLAIYTVFLFAPYIWAIYSSFKTEPEFAQSALNAPIIWRFDNFLKCFTELEVQGVNFISMLINSITLVVLMTLPSIAFPVMLAYAVSKYPCKFTKTISSVNLIRMTVPVLGSWPAMYGLIKALNIINNPMTIWLMWCGGAGGMFFTLLAFFNGVSSTYMEAAKVDGAGNWCIFLKIMLPQSMGIITAFIISTAIGAWNDYETAFLYFYDYPTVGLGLYKFKELQTYRANRPILFMGIILSMIPPLVVFSCFSKIIMRNVSIGGIKG